MLCSAGENVVWKILSRHIIQSNRAGYHMHVLSDSAVKPRVKSQAPSHVSYLGIRDQ